MRWYSVNIPLFSLVVVIVCGALVYRIARLLLASKLPKEHVVPGSPLLVSYYSQNKALQSSFTGKVAGMLCVMFAVDAEPAYGEGGDFVYNDESAVIYSFILPFVTASHVVGITQKGDTDLGLQEFLAKRQLERIELEGDFSDSFMLYAPPGNQADARYLLDPKAMKFVADFCEQYNFEIQDKTLTLVSSAATQSAPVGDGTFAGMVERFVAEIRPAMAVKNDLTTAEVPYGMIEGEPQCPRCTTKLELQHDTCTCPRGHGVLIFGAQMIALRSASRGGRPTTALSKHEADIACPNCHHLMQQINYQDIGVFIDTCTFCGYRWLDKGEYEAIFGHPSTT